MLMKTVPDIRERIHELEALRARWQTEVGSSESGMKEADIRFLTRQIQRLEWCEAKVIVEFERVEQAIIKRTRDW